MATASRYAKRNFGAKTRIQVSFLGTAKLIVGTLRRQGGRTWQPFVGSKNGNENFRQARIYNFRVKCVVFARNRKFANLTK